MLVYVMSHGHIVFSGAAAEVRGKDVFERSPGIGVSP
jgi:hypothetical protein